MSCFCGNDASITECCGPLLAGDRQPQTAEQLMRSRYTAYVQQNIDYLVATQDPQSREGFDRQSAEDWAAQARWKGLQVVSTERGGPDDDVGVVEFIASYVVDGELRAHHERSRFRRLDGRWVYTDGHPPRAERKPQIGRNQKCPCGSGKKYKRCCGR